MLNQDITVNASANGRGKPFDPSKHITRIKFRGGPERDYLGVAARVMWLRSLYPDAVIETWCISDEVGVRSTWGARVTLPSGASATGFGSRSKADNRGDYYEAGETRALGRALAHLGIATEYIDPDEMDEMDEGRDDTGQPAAVDSGRERRPSGQSGQPSAQRPLQQAPPPEPRLNQAQQGKWMVRAQASIEDANVVRQIAHDLTGRAYTEMTLDQAKTVMEAIENSLLEVDGDGRYRLAGPPEKAGE